MPGHSQRVRFPADFGQRFLLTVDTEEEFDWSRPIRREGYTLHSVARLARFQEFCEGAGVVPVYLVDFPVATSPTARAALCNAVAQGKAEIGVQLHPWVNPPHDEDVTEANSFAGNLPVTLEREKFRRLRSAIEDGFGTTPLIYRAGRYGLGPGTADMLIEHGMAIDTSVRSRFDYSAVGGPDYRDHPVSPWWVDPDQRLMELPLTTVYWGLLRQFGPKLYPMMWRMPQLRGLLAKTGLLERIPLTPEGITLEEAIRGIDIALDEGLAVLVFAFHSPSLAPGFTPYVSSEADLDAFYDWWRGVFAYLRQRNVASTSVKDLMQAVTLA
ncbi:polysaccharide deacetylase family protein [Novosphingobium sp. APW14]|uniref:polysaccharide deacetylase family protein n=1 Tax=Novosphingobium sp. APW14 TaxID=3077237 RepID=UPI0028DF2B10|nr:polysaccharide deacetylase family protein [Novosphingobium sp. APW14]MDT9012990.1 polysaccharide deacetylase family protein [Novosphingobium sp. APW14]